jgi:hypothetical protein
MKHKHYDMIVAWAEGKHIQCNNPDRDWSAKWEDEADPSWYDFCEYRIKPEPKPDVVRNITVEATLKCGETCGEAFVQVFKSGKYIFPNLRLTFDGETGKLKSAEVL